LLGDNEVDDLLAALVKLVDKVSVKGNFLSSIVRLTVAYGLGGNGVSWLLALEHSLGNVLEGRHFVDSDVEKRLVPSGCGVRPLQPAGVICEQALWERVLIASFQA